MSYLIHLNFDEHFTSYNSNFKNVFKTFFGQQASFYEQFMKHCFKLQFFKVECNFFAGYSAAVGWVPNPEQEPANMHRKLQRQLTLNPSFDPRLFHLRRNNQSSTSANDEQSVIHPGHPLHRPLTRHLSNEASYPVSLRY